MTELKGFGCKAHVSGRKRAYFIQYRPGGSGENIKRVHIGNHGRLTVATSAERTAKDVLGKVERGRHPHVAENRKERA